jgi:hypothetical protein
MIEALATTPDALRMGLDFQFVAHREILQMELVDDPTQQITFARWLDATNRSEFVKPGEKWAEAAPVFKSMKRGMIHLPEFDKPGATKAYEATTFDVTTLFEDVKLQEKMMGKPKVEVGKELLDQVAITLTEAIGTEKDALKDDAIFILTRKGLGQRLGKQIDKLIGNESMISAEGAGSLLDRAVNKITLRGLSDAFQSIMNPKKMDKKGVVTRNKFVLYSGFFLNDIYISGTMLERTMETIAGIVRPNEFWETLGPYTSPVLLGAFTALGTLHAALVADMLMFNQIEATHSVGEKWEITLLKPQAGSK